MNSLQRRRGAEEKAKGLVTGKPIVNFAPLRLCEKLSVVRQVSRKGAKALRVCSNLCFA
jgi:hypothetical protein